MLSGSLVTFVSHQIYGYFTLGSGESKFINTYQNPKGCYVFQVDW